MQQAAKCEVAVQPVLAADHLILGELHRTPATNDGKNIRHCRLRAPVLLCGEVLPKLRSCRLRFSTRVMGEEVGI
jgi:hypothetical protein